MATSQNLRTRQERLISQESLARAYLGPQVAYVPYVVTSLHPFDGTPVLERYDGGKHSDREIHWVCRKAY